MEKNLYLHLDELSVANSKNITESSSRSISLSRLCNGKECLCCVSVTVSFLLVLLYANKFISRPEYSDFLHLLSKELVLYYLSSYSGDSDSTSPDTSEIRIGSTSAAQEPSGGSSTGIIVAVVIIIIIIIVIIIAVVVIVILVLRSKQKKDFYANLPNSKGGGDTLVKMGDVETSGKFTKSGMNDELNNIDHKGGRFGGETGMDTSKLRYDKTGETYSVVNDAGRSYSAVDAGESDQLYNRLRANEKKQQNLADQTYSVLQREEELTVSQPGSVTEAVYSDADSNHERRHTSPSDVYAQVDKSKGKPKKPKPYKKQEVLEEYAMIGTTGAPEIPNKSISLLKDLNSKPTNPLPSKLSALSNLAIPSDSLSVNPLYDSAGGTYEEGIMDNVYAEPGAAIIQEPNPGGNIYEAIYSESLNPSSFLREVSPDESQYSDELCPYSSIYSVPLVNTDEKPLEVTAKNIQKIKILGSGNFGEVLLAKTVGLSCRDLRISQSTDTNVMVQVAVKMLKTDASANTKKDFEKEYQFMSRLNDPNVIRLLGVCVTGTSFIMMEYMENGDLNQFLKKYETVVDRNASRNVDITRSTLVYICTQIASAMKYLASKNFVHRDLATRNCLVGENFHVKISDFGMSRSLYESHYYIIHGHAILPIRWMATECFYGKFSAKTDVWAFGATMWEVFVLSKYEPYFEFEDRQLVEDACKGPNRTLLSRPQECPVNVYQIMTRCWVHDPSQRATFEELYEMLSSIKQL